MIPYDPFSPENKERAIKYAGQALGVDYSPDPHFAYQILEDLFDAGYRVGCEVNY